MDRRGTGPLGGGARRLRADLPAGQAGWERRRPGAGAAAAALGGLAIDHSLQVARPLASGSNEVSSGGRIPTSAARTKTWSASATPPRIGHRVYVLFLSGPGCEHTFVTRGPRFTEPQLRKAIAQSRSWAETLRDLQYRAAGGNWLTLKKYAH